MLHYERIDVIEGTDFEKTDKSKDCEVCNYTYFQKWF